MNAFTSPRLWSRQTLSVAISLWMLPTCCVTAEEADAVETLYHGPRAVYAVAYSPRGNIIAWPTAENSVALRQLKPTNAPEIRRVRKLLGDLNADQFDTRQHAFLRLARLGRDVEDHLRAQLPDAPSVEVRARVEVLLDALQPAREDAHQGDIRAMAISHDGQTIISAGKDRVVKFWSVARGGVTRVIRGHTESVWSVAIAPDDSIVATGSGDNTIRLWELSSGRMLAVLRGHRSVVHDLAFSSDGERLAAAGSFDNTVTIWDVPTRTRVQTLTHRSAPMCALYSPSDRLLATGGYGGIVTLWDTKTWQPRQELTATKKAVRAIAFAPNGRILVTGGDDRAVRFWDVQDGVVLRVFSDYGGAIHDVALSPDGKSLITAAADGGVQRRLGLTNQ